MKQSLATDLSTASKQLLFTDACGSHKGDAYSITGLTMALITFNNWRTVIQITKQGSINFGSFTSYLLDIFISSELLINYYSKFKSFKTTFVIILDYLAFLLLSVIIINLYVILGEVCNYLILVFNYLNRQHFNFIIINYFVCRSTLLYSHQLYRLH